MTELLQVAEVTESRYTDETLGFDSMRVLSYA